MHKLNTQFYYVISHVTTTDEIRTDVRLMRNSYDFLQPWAAMFLASARQEGSHPPEPFVRFNDTCVQRASKKRKFKPITRKATKRSRHMSDDDINLNVSGTKLATLRSTLCQVKDSMLATMFSGRWENHIDRDQDGAANLDYNPQHFEMILGYLDWMKLGTLENPPLPKVPKDQRDSLKELVQYLILSNEITLSEIFNLHSSGVTLEEGGLVAVHNQTPKKHEYVLGKYFYSQGTVIVKLKLEFFRRHWWMFLGVTKANENQSQASVSGRTSCTWAGSYGWNIGSAWGWVFENGTCTNKGDMSGNVSKRGDTVQLVLECEAGKLSLLVPTGQKFDIDVPRAQTWRLFVSLFGKDDRIRILED